MTLTSLRKPTIGVVDIWRIPLGDPDGYDELLSPAERERLRTRIGTGRVRFVQSHAALRRIVALYQGCAPRLAALRVPYGQAPRADGIELSLAYCDDIALVAVATTPVGVDVEPRAAGHDEDLDELAELTLSRRELATFRSAPDRAATWLRAWTRKEAVLKARGEGIGERLVSEIDVASEHVEELTLSDLAPTEEHVGAVALRNPETTMVWKELA